MVLMKNVGNVLLDNKICRIALFSQAASLVGAPSTKYLSTMLTHRASFLSQHLSFCVFLKIVFTPGVALVVSREGCADNE